MTQHTTQHNNLATYRRNLSQPHRGTSLRPFLVLLSILIAVLTASCSGEAENSVPRTLKPSTVTPDPTEDPPPSPTPTVADMPSCRFDAEGVHGLRASVFDKSGNRFYAIHFGAGASIKRWMWMEANLVGPSINANAVETDEVFQWTLWSVPGDENPEAPEGSGFAHLPWNINQAGDNETHAADMAPHSIRIHPTKCKISFSLQSKYQWLQPAESYYRGRVQSIIEYEFFGDGSFKKRNILRPMNAGYTANDGSEVNYTALRLADWTAFDDRVVTKLEAEFLGSSTTWIELLEGSDALPMRGSNGVHATGTVRATTSLQKSIAVVFSTAENERVPPSKIRRVGADNRFFAALSLIYLPVDLADRDILVYETEFVLERTAQQFSTSIAKAHSRLAPPKVIKPSEADYVEITNRFTAPNDYLDGWRVVNGLIEVVPLDAFFDEGLNLPVTRETYSTP